MSFAIATVGASAVAEGNVVHLPGETDIGLNPNVSTACGCHLKNTKSSLGRTKHVYQGTKIVA
jgi:hypothetical protein